jgi:hypothetical protein
MSNYVLMLENLQVITHCLYESKIRRGQKEGPGSWLHMREALFRERDKCDELRRQLGVERRYIEALERQLEPSVIEEIKDELSALEHEEEAG